MKWGVIAARPKEWEYVLVWGHATQREHAVGIGRWYLHSSGQVFWDINGVSGQSLGPSHWMPLPVPPTSETEVK